MVGMLSQANVDIACFRAATSACLSADLQDRFQLYVE